MKKLVYAVCLSCVLTGTAFTQTQTTAPVGNYTNAGGGGNMAVIPGGGCTVPTCTGNNTLCCPNGKNGCPSCCSKSHLGIVNGKQTSYNLDCLPFDKIEEGSSGGKVVPGEAVAVAVQCAGFTSAAGHKVPATDATLTGKSVTIGCFTYTCTGSSSGGKWTTSYSGCACEPNTTYYSTCGDCSTKTRVCRADGTFPIGISAVCDDGSSPINSSTMMNGGSTPAVNMSL
jgi:hypothetical protein